MENSFAAFWTMCEDPLGPAWKRRLKYGQSPTGIPDSARSAPRRLDLVDLYRGRSAKRAERLPEVWRLLLGSAGVIISVFVALVLTPAFASYIEPWEWQWILAPGWWDVAIPSVAGAFFLWRLWRRR